MQGETDTHSFLKVCEELSGCETEINEGEKYGMCLDLLLYTCVMRVRRKAEEGEDWMHLCVDVSMCAAATLVGVK